MAAVTASTMIVASLISIGEKSIGYTLSSGEQTHYLARLNAFLDSLALNRLMVPYLTEDSFALTSGDNTYTIGQGGDFNTVRPLKIEQAWVRDSSNVDLPVEVIEDEKAYNEIALKSTTGTYPSYLLYKGYTYTGQGLTGAGVGNGTIKLYPTPGANLTLYLLSLKPLQQFGGIDVPIQLPPGYQRFIESNFAIEIAGEMVVPASVAKVARESKAALLGFNSPARVMRMDYGVAGHRRYDINSDE